jgi:catechol 2,3-dioxygenase-like lactoylglutathione lyase family enzyme
VREILPTEIAAGDLLMSAFKSSALVEENLQYVAPRRAKPSRVLHFTLSVADLDRARKFYEEVVGCTFWRRNETTVFMRCGDDHFVLSRTGYHAPQNRNRDTLIHHAFVLQNEDFDAALAHVEACGVEVLLYEDAGHTSFPGRHAYFNDPDGNCIEFVYLREPGDPATTGPQGGRRPKSHLNPVGD